MRQLWKKFDRGDHLSTSELNSLLDSAKAAEQYLAARDSLAVVKTRFDINRITDYINARTSGM